MRNRQIHNTHNVIHCLFLLPIVNEASVVNVEEDASLFIQAFHLNKMLGNRVSGVETNGPNWCQAASTPRRPELSGSQHYTALNHPTATGSSRLLDVHKQPHHPGLNSFIAAQRRERDSGYVTWRLVFMFLTLFHLTICTSSKKLTAFSSASNNFNNNSHQYRFHQKIGTRHCTNYLSSMLSSL